MSHFSRIPYPGRLALFIAWGYIVLCIPFVLVISSSRLMMTETFLRLEYNRPGFPDDPYGFSIEDRLTLGPKGIEYIFSEQGIEYLGDLTLPGEVCFPPNNQDCPAFENRELQHMEDVKDVADLVFQSGFLIGALWIGVAAILWREHPNILWVALMQGGMATIGIMITLIALAVASWDTFFGSFHKMFFEDGTWQFFYSDTLIRLYPQQFWFDATLLVGGFTAGGAILFIIIGNRQSNRFGIGQVSSTQKL